MKIYYQTATERIEVETEERWGNVILSMNEKEKNKKTVAARHEVYANENDEDFFDCICADDYDENRLAEENRQQKVQEVQSVLEKMKPKQAQLLKAVYMDGVSQKELARLQGVSPAAINQRVKCAKESFKKLFTALQTKKGKFPQ